MNKILLLIITILASQYTLAEQLIPRSVTGDKGKYYLISQTKSGDIVSTIHKRIGIDSVGYSSTKVNCKTGLLQDIGYSEVSIKAIKPNPTKWYELVKGSSKYDLYRFVCKK